MENVYVLMEEGWEYNDETYFHPESGSGTPTKAFATNEAAQKECDARNVESIRNLFTSGEANQYFYSFNDIIPYTSKKDREFTNKLEGLCQKIFGTGISGINDLLEEGDGVDINEGTTDQDWLDFQSMTTLNFWNVVEVEKA